VVINHPVQKNNWFKFGTQKKVRVKKRKKHDWLVVSTHLKNMSQNCNLPQNRDEHKKIFETAT